MDFIRFKSIVIHIYELHYIWVVTLRKCVDFIIYCANVGLSDRLGCKHGTVGFALHAEYFSFAIIKDAIFYLFVIFEEILFYETPSFLVGSRV